VFVTIGDILGKRDSRRWLVGGVARDQHRRNSSSLSFEHNARSRDMDIADNRASRWSVKRDAGTQGCKWENKMQVERKTCLRGCSGRGWEMAGVDGVEAQPTFEDVFHVRTAHTSCRMTSTVSRSEVRLFHLFFLSLCSNGFCFVSLVLYTQNPDCLLFLRYNLTKAIISYGSKTKTDVALPFIVAWPPSFRKIAVTPKHVTRKEKQISSTAFRVDQVAGVGRIYVVVKQERNEKVMLRSSKRCSGNLRMP
jgi:hypothetical protein